MAKDESLALRTREKFNEIFRGVTIVSELALGMAGGSAMDVLRERMTRKLEALGEWPGLVGRKHHRRNPSAWQSVGDP